MAITRKTGSVVGLGPQLREMRLALTFGQVAFAKALGTDAGTLSKWERGVLPIPAAAVLKIMEIAPQEEKHTWLQAAGLSIWDQPVASRRIPLLKDATAVGTPRADDEDEIKLIFELANDLLPREAGRLQAAYTPDDGMSPMLGKGRVAIVDVSERRPEKLLTFLVLSCDDEGVYVRWLRRQLGEYVLFSNDLEKYPLKRLDTRRNCGLIGRVVLWLGSQIEI
jgi:transcriptional regulator with XRE-family HTH domain